MLTIHPLKLADLPAARRLSDAAGWNQLDSDWQRLITLWPMTTLAGFLNNQLIATASLTTFAPPPGRSLNFGWIGVMLVDTAHRGAGHGSTMFDAALRAGADRGIIDYGLDATDLGRPLYLKRNFTDRFPIHRWSRPTSPSHKPADVIGAVRPLTDSDWPQLLTLDLQATQLNRTPLLKHLAAEPNTHLLIAEQNQKILGYALLRPGRVAHYIGPLIATTPQLAASLLNSLLTLPTTSTLPLYIDIAAGDPLEPHLLAANFTIARKLSRMARASTNCPVAHSPQVHAIAGLELC